MAVTVTSPTTTPGRPLHMLDVMAGLVLFVVGTALSLTIIGLIVGAPMALIGLELLNRPRD